MKRCETTFILIKKTFLGVSIEKIPDEEGRTCQKLDSEKWTNTLSYGTKRDSLRG